MLVFLYNTLNERQRRQIKGLHDRCLSAVPASSALLSLVLPEEGEVYEDTFYLTFEANGKLLSFLSVFCPDGDTVEISGFTDPAERHHGYFSRLLSTAKKEAEQRFHPLMFCTRDFPKIPIRPPFAGTIIFPCRSGNV
ncbi:MAG: GNAT family N-acetyltransferase [Lachnospiraceae bacterium]